MSAYNCGLKPFGDQVVVELESRQETKKGELYIPKTANENKPMQGKVVVVGPGKEDADTSVFTVGSQVLFRQYTGTEFERDSKKYLVLRAGDIMCEVIE